jgi:acyl carrier protein
MKNLDLMAHFENEFKIKISPATISLILNKFNLNDDTYDTDSNQLNIQSL